MGLRNRAGAVASGKMNGRNGMAAPKGAIGAAARKLKGYSVDFANGGAIVRHNEDNSGDGPYREGAQHVFTTSDDLHAHLKSLYPIPDATVKGPRANIMEPGEQA